jgi:hypothetical protein
MYPNKKKPKLFFLETTRSSSNVVQELEKIFVD